MKKLTMILAVACVLAARADDKESALVEAATKFVEQLSQKKFADATGNFDDAMKKAMPAAELEKMWKTLDTQVGAFQKQEGTRRETVQGYEIVYVRCEFARAALEARIVFDAQRRIAGLFFSPAKAATLEKESGEAIELVTKTGKISGTLDLPHGNGPFPAVVIIAGSGPTDRNGNQALTRTNNLKLLSTGLAERGVGALRYDKRGVGASAEAGPKEEDLRFDHYVEDAAAWVERLREDKRFSRVGIVGHSEGAQLGALAAGRAKAEAFVSLEGAGRPAPAVIRGQLAGKLVAMPALKERSDKILDELTAGRRVEDVPQELLVLFRPSVQPYLISWFPRDPARELAKLQIPVLIVQGTTDLQVTVEDAKLLAAAKKDAELFIIEGMCHTLKEAKTLADQQAAYTDPKLPLAPKLVDKVAAFLSQTLGQKK